MRTSLWQRSIAISILLVLSTSIFPTKTNHVLAASVSAEWSAVGEVTAPWDAQNVMNPVMHAIGFEALRDSALLQLTAEAFLADQTGHPAYLMAAIQWRYRSLYNGRTDAYGILLIEQINQTYGLLNLNTGDAVSERALVQHIIVGPLATSFLQSASRPVDTPTTVPTPVPSQEPPTLTPSSDPPIFPEIRHLLSGITRSKATYAGLKPNDIQGSVKPQSRTEVDWVHTGVTLRISIFSTNIKAAASFTGLLHHLAPGSVILPSTSQEPGTVRYTVAGYNVVALLFRNIEAVTSALTSRAPMDSVQSYSDNVYFTLRNYSEPAAIPTGGSIVVRPSHAHVGTMVTISGSTNEVVRFLPPAIVMISLAQLDHPVTHSYVSSVAHVKSGANFSCQPGTGQVAFALLQPSSQIPSSKIHVGTYPKHTFWSIRFIVPSTLLSEDRAGHSHVIATPVGVYVLMLTVPNTDGSCVPPPTDLAKILIRLTVEPKLIPLSGHEIGHA